MTTFTKNLRGFTKRTVRHRLAVARIHFHRARLCLHTAREAEAHGDHDMAREARRQYEQHAADWAFLRDVARTLLRNASK